MLLAKVLFLALPAFGQCLNVLFYVAAIAQSHIPFHNTAIQLILDRGHSVDIVLAHYNDVVKIKFPEGIRRNYSLGYKDKETWRKSSMHLENIFEQRPTPLAEFSQFDDAAFEFCKIAIEDVELLEFIKSGSYDIGISSDYDPCANVIMHAAGVRSKASLIPTPMFQSQVVHAGLPTVASLYGSVLHPKPDTSFYGRLFDLIRHTYNLYYAAPKVTARYNQLLKSAYGPSFPDVSEIERNIDVIFANSNEIIEKPRPIGHKIKYVGGIGKKSAKALSKEFDDLLSSAPNGVVIFSFGTQVPTKKVPTEIRKNFVNAFKQFPDTLFLWKYDNLTDDKEMFEHVPNIHRVKWLPQTDLLGDSRVKVFISHLGLNSYLETSAAGVPVLAIPLFIDQQHNSFNAVDRQTAIIVDRDRLTVDNLVSALSELLNNPKYRQNAWQISNMMKQKPEQSEQLFVEWVEFTAKNPGLHKVLNLPGAELTPFWYYCGDVVLVIAAAFLLSIITIRTISKFVFSTVSKKKVE